MNTITVIDSHTGGEPTRLIVDGGPNLGTGTVAEQAAIFESQFDQIRTAVIAEPRGSDIFVGGILCKPCDERSTAGVAFFDNAGLIGMCGHGTMGLMVSLHYLGQIALGEHWIETPVGIVSATLLAPNRVCVKNVASYREVKDIEIDVPGHEPVVGDIVWGGNWFFLVKKHNQILEKSNTTRLLEFTKRIRRQLAESGVTAADGSPIRHVELIGPSENSKANARNFVLCPGGEYDRSPCGTGTSAKIACLAEDNQLSPGQIWYQESIVGTIFESTFDFDAQGRVIPQITGTAYVTAESKLVLDPDDPFCFGIDR